MRKRWHPFDIPERFCGGGEPYVPFDVCVRSEGLANMQCFYFLLLIYIKSKRAQFRDPVSDTVVRKAM